ncbi:GNAT family N-acetyltransferase [Shewanella psychropiezotolerans]|uniref:GNAT family N-acetyltransferase n=1 Tax=Shewanella psychropiezotolerans TaxID=2593655 RepID=A0ABX5WS13_9GAMM|nr:MULTISPECIES: GNAT family N-acetyltransferase [Shewanella]MPY26397.1 GNAT family N-acetyltransferase [Shewanella sp. YLB-07]QDO81908.1 GNAT family N-acetyltransferase [Shewanella psychropiezotolerans]
MELVLLADKPKAIPQIAKWYSDEWGHISNDSSRSTSALETKLNGYLNTDKLPLMLLATVNNQMVATAQLRFQEMTTYPETSHWLGGVYVDKAHRGKAIGQSLINGILDLARRHQVSELYLQTEDHSGGLYKKMGWKAVEQVTYHGVKVLVMKLKVNERVCEEQKRA